nr:MAG: hypothetical protein BECKTUN1418D_GA0071000_102019 [Candidatus Kentron sp. TUN]
MKRVLEETTADLADAFSINCLRYRMHSPAIGIDLPRLLFDSDTHGGFDPNFTFTIKTPGKISLIPKTIVN